MVGWMMVGRLRYHASEKIQMRVPIGRDGWYLCDQCDDPDDDPRVPGNRSMALQWVNQFRGDHFAWCSLHRLLGGASPPRSDEEVAREVSWRLCSGGWMARWRIPETRAKGVAGRNAPTALAFPVERRPSRSPQATHSPEADAPLFPSDIDAAAIAGAQDKRPPWVCPSVKNALGLKWRDDKHAEHGPR